MKKYLKIGLALLILGVTLVILVLSYYAYSLSPVSNNKTMKEIVIEANTTGGQIATILEDKKLIKNGVMFRVYLKINGIANLKSGIYKLNENMGVKQIVKLLKEGKGSQIGEIDILFREGETIRDFAKTIAAKTSNSEASFLNLMTNETYIDSLIEKHWFLTDDIKDEDIYYPLEGYLAPNTYRLNGKDTSLEDIVTIMLNQTNSILTPLKDEIQNSNFTIHEFMTMASIVEAEGVNDDDRAKIAGVFYNRLDQHISFQSCATNCYATRTDVCTPDKVIKTYPSPYNTYLSNMAGKLPIGPIGNPGADSIEATINPDNNDYLFFLADIHKNTYFSKTNAQHEAKINELKEAGLWFQ